MRFLPPIVFLGTASGVHFYNASQSGRVLTFPFLERLFPSMARNPQAMGEATVMLRGAIGGLMLLRVLMSTFQGRGA